jgi:hypothetical protein
VDIEHQVSSIRHLRVKIDCLAHTIFNDEEINATLGNRLHGINARAPMGGTFLSRQTIRWGWKTPPIEGFHGPGNGYGIIHPLRRREIFVRAGRGFFVDIS